MRRHPKGPRRVRPRRRLPGGATLNAGLTSAARREDAPEQLNEGSEDIVVEKNKLLQDVTDLSKMDEEERARGSFLISPFA